MRIHPTITREVSHGSSAAVYLARIAGRPLAARPLHAAGPGTGGIRPGTHSTTGPRTTRKTPPLSADLSRSGDRRHEPPGPGLRLLDECGEQASLRRRPVAGPFRGY